MIEHEDKVYDDMDMRPLELSRRAMANFYNGECEIVLVTGMPEGIGKSVYVSHALADTQGYLKCHDKDMLPWMWKHRAERPADVKIWDSNYEAAKELIKYPPSDVVNYLMSLRAKGIKVPMWHWDDAGTWLNSMEYTDPFVIAFMEFLPLARTVTGLVVLSSPVEEWVLKKLHTASGIIHAPIIKLKDNRYFWRPRECHAYKKVHNAWRNRTFPQYVWRDQFTAIEPDSFHKWYAPRRDHYCTLATAKMAIALQKRKEKGIHVEIDEVILAELRHSVEEANDMSKEFLEVLRQTAT